MLQFVFWKGLKIDYLKISMGRFSVGKHKIQKSLLLKFINFFWNSKNHFHNEMFRRHLEIHKLWYWTISAFKYMIFERGLDPRWSDVLREYFLLTSFLILIPTQNLPLFLWIFKWHFNIYCSAYNIFFSTQGCVKETYRKHWSGNVWIL